MSTLSVSVLRRACVEGKREVEIAPSAELAAVRGAEIFLEGARRAIRERNRFTVALSGGSSPAPLFRKIAGQAAASHIEWSAVHLFWADERCVPPDHPDSNFRMASELLLSRLPAPGPVVHRIAGELPPGEAARRYEEELSRTFPHTGIPVFDMILLGVGSDGHTASLFPEMEAWEFQERFAIAVYVEKMASHRVTLTLPVINNARHVLFLVTGAGKADIVVEILAGEDRARYPAARIAPTKGVLTWLLDADAGRNLRHHHGKM